jgi:H+/Cl- antiporter ClcA
VLRGVQLEGYLNFKTLIAVLLSLTFTLSSNIPIGKAGPFVHAAASVANLVSKFIKSFDTGTMTGSMQNEMLAAGCAVGLGKYFNVIHH